MMSILRMVGRFALALARTTRARRAARGPARPTWSFQFEWMLEYLRTDWHATSATPFAQLRAEVDARPYPRTMVRRTKIRDAKLGGVPTRWFTAPDADESHVILFFHGGSYIYGSVRTTHADLCARLALMTKAAVAGVEYRLAPEHPFPAQLEDARAAFAALVESGVTEDRIVVAGDSAGGNLAIELQIALRDEGRPQAAAAVLLSPWSDLRMPGRSFADNERFDFGTRDVLVKHAEAFAGKHDLDDPRISPVNAKLDGLAPTLIVAGEVEIPRDDILEIARRLEDAKVAVTLHVAPDMPHNAALFAAYHPNGMRALEEVARFTQAIFERA